MPKIHSTIDITYQGCRGDCEMGKHKKRVRKNPEKVSFETKKPHDHRYHSEASTEKNRFFHRVKNANAGVNQTVNVDLKVEQGDDCLTSAIKACFGRGN